MQTNKYILALGLATAIVGGAMAMTSVSAVEKPLVQKVPNMVLEVGPSGRTLIRGTVTAVGTDSLTVKSWGGLWVVNVSSTTKLAPRVDMAQFAVGDFVGAQGVMSTAADWTINATLVRNWTIRQTINDNKKEIKTMIKSVTARNWQGVVVGDVNADGSFKLQVGGTTYDIKLATGAKVVDKNYFTLASGSIKAGDTVRVYGPAQDTTITASVVRDVSWDLKMGTR